MGGGAGRSTKKKLSIPSIPWIQISTALWVITTTGSAGPPPHLQFLFPVTGQQ